MLRFIKTIILGVILVALVLIAVANRDPMTVNLVPEALAGLLPIQNALTLPKYMILLAAIAVGLLIGYLFEYIREHKHRRKVNERSREVSKLETEVAKLRKKTGDDQDDVVALLN